MNESSMQLARLRFGVWDSVFGVWSSDFGVQGLGFRVWGSGFGGQGLGFRVESLGFRVWRNSMAPRNAHRNQTRLQKT